MVKQSAAMHTTLTVQVPSIIDIIYTRFEGKHAWASYWNEAILISGTHKKTITWLESILARRQDGQWKLILLHSTTHKTITDS